MVCVRKCVYVHVYVYVYVYLCMCVCARACMYACVCVCRLASFLSTCPPCLSVKVPSPYPSHLSILGAAISLLPASAPTTLL